MTLDNIIVNLKGWNNRILSLKTPFLM